MYEHTAGSSQTVSSGEVGESANSRSVQRAFQLVEQFKRSEILKAAAILGIEEALASSEVAASGGSLAEVFPTYLEMLDKVDSASCDVRQGNKRVQHSHLFDGSDRGSSKWRGDSNREHRSRRSSATLHSESPSVDEEPARKRARRTVDESLFPWGVSASVRRVGLSADLQQILELLDNWANDPTLVVRKILLSPGCPDFSYDQWQNIVKGQAVDLTKVLGAHYSTEIDTQQSQDVGDLFQIPVRTSKQSKAIRTHGDWIIAFGKTIQATCYALPQRHTEYLEYQTYISCLFASVHPAHHDRVIELDKAIRLKAANQKHLRFNELSKFEDVWQEL